MGRRYRSRFSPALEDSARAAAHTEKFILERVNSADEPIRRNPSHPKTQLSRLLAAHKAARSGINRIYRRGRHVVGRARFATAAPHVFRLRRDLVSCVFGGGDQSFVGRTH